MKSIFIDGISEGSWTGGGGDAHAELDTAKLATFRVAFAKDEGAVDVVYGGMLVTALSESLEEGYAQRDVLSDSFVTLATGAMPTGITMRGFVARLPEQDGRIDFLDLYDKYLRGTQVEKAALDLEVLLKGRCVFKLALQNVQVNESTQYENLTEITLAGVGYDYQPVPWLGDADET